MLQMLHGQIPLQWCVLASLSIGYPRHVCMQQGAPWGISYLLLLCIYYWCLWGMVVLWFRAHAEITLVSCVSHASTFELPTVQTATSVCNKFMWLLTSLPCSSFPATLNGSNTTRVPFCCLPHAVNSHATSVHICWGSWANMLCDAQVVRLSSQDVPTAYAFELEAATIVQPEEVEAAVQRVVAGAPVLA